MFLRTTKVKQKNGVAEFVQLVHNVRHPETGVPRPQVLHHFGRADQLDIDALRRLVRSISRFLEPEEAARINGQMDNEPPFEFLGSRQIGGTWLLDGLWKRLEIDQVLGQLLAKRKFARPIERLLFAMVANRALAPSSKLAVERWATDTAHVPGLESVEVHQLYAAMDFLLAAADDIQKAVFFNVASLLNLEVDIVFIDTTSTYFEVEQPDDPGDERLNLRRRGHSKDNHPELPQVVIGFAVTREGIPVRCWVWPGNTGDQSVVEEVKRDLNGWKLGRVVTVADAGFNSADNRRILQQAGGHFIVGEKLRPGPGGHPAEALSRQGRFRTLDNGLEIKEVKIGGDGAASRRFVIVRNPDEARRDAAKREDILAEVRRRLDDLKQLESEPHEKAACALRAHAVYGRYVIQNARGQLSLDREKIRQEELVDGKFLVSSSDDTLSAEDIVSGYKALWKIERAFRDLKHVLDIRPIYHRLSDRIRAHVLLCWLALLLVRVAENETGQNWGQIRSALARLQLGIHKTSQGEVWQTNRSDDAQKTIFEAVNLSAPPRYYAIPVPRK